MNAHRYVSLACWVLLILVGLSALHRIGAIRIILLIVIATVLVGSHLLEEKK